MNDSDRLETISPREREILALIADGLSTRRIAESLHLSTKTVDAHRRNLYRKTGYQSIALLTKLAVRSGLSDL